MSPCSTDSAPHQLSSPEGSRWLPTLPLRGTSGQIIDDNRAVRQPLPLPTPPRKLITQAATPACCSVKQLIEQHAEIHFNRFQLCCVDRSGGVQIAADLYLF